MFEEVIWIFAAAGALAFIGASISAPIGLLSWWAGERSGDDEMAEPGAPAPTGATRFVVYFGGIDAIDGDRHSPRERRFLDALARRLGDAIVVDTVFPYAASGESLLRAPRVFGWLWRALAPAPEATRRPLRAYIINFRNLFQVLVAADRRYGPIYGAALTHVVVDALYARGWRRGAALVLVGYSGGAQMALSVANQLGANVGAPIYVVSIGGTIVEADGVNHVARLAYLTGSADPLPRMAAMTSFDRWPGVNSAWARAERDGRIERLCLGKMRHLGPDGYIGDAVQVGAPKPNWEITLDAVAQFLEAARIADR